ncbi:MAG: transglutaminase-like cysteine peptidase [Kiloniellales bacterium]
MPRRSRATAAAICLIAFLGPFLGAVPGLPLPESAAQTLSDLAAVSRSARSGLFDSVEFSNSSLEALPQWNRVIRKMRREGAAFAACVADESQCHNAPQRAWRKLLAQASRLDRKERIESVNNFFNRWPYKLDSELYGVSEYWATPAEFMARSGDCEDYAIAKFFALRQLGFDNEALRIVILWDQIRATGHAVLAVYEPEGVIILDSLSGLIVPDSRYHHYIPQYSMNETTRWSHVHSKKIPHAWASRN